MPTRETTPEQQQDAKRLKAIYLQWVKDTPAGEPKRTQDDVAEALGKGQSTVAQTLNGKLALTVERAIRLANLFGCKVADFSPSLAEVIGEPSTAAIAQQPQHAGSEGTTEANYLSALRDRLLQASGEESVAIGEALRQLAVTPDSERAFSNAADLILYKDGKVQAVAQMKVTEPEATDEDWRDLRKRAMRLAEKSHNPVKREHAAQLLRMLDETLRDAAGTEKPTQSRHGNNSPTSSPR